jgi:hypothetical protein
LSLDLDNFSALVIYVALRALAADPVLWNKHVESSGHDKLLFRLEDFRHPAASPLYRDLRNSPAQDVRDLSEQLLSLWQATMDQVPPLVYLTNSYAKVEQLLANQQWEEAVRILNRRGHFRDAPKHLQPQIHQAYEFVCRKQAWQNFKKLPASHSELNDRKLVNAWNETLFAGFEPAEGERPRLEAARKHVQMLDRLHHLVQQSGGASDLAREQAMVSAADQLPKGYQYSLQPRVTHAKAVVNAVRRIRAALDLADDRETVAAWRLVVQAHCENLVSPKDRTQVQLAERRLWLANRLHGLSHEMPPDQLDQQLLELWQEDLLQGVEEAERWRTAYETARYRRDLLARIGEAIGNRDEPAIVQALRDPALADFPLPDSWHGAIQAAKDRMEAADALQCALQSDDRSRFLQLFDIRLIRQHAERFEPHQARLAKWTEEEVLPAEAMGLRPAIARASVVPMNKADLTFRVRWTWPQQRFTEECILAVCETEPQMGEDPREVAAGFREPIDRSNWEGGGGSRVIHAESAWLGHSVTVWAVVDLGFRLLFSHPLVLGTLGQPRRKTGQPWKLWTLFRSRKDNGSAVPPRAETRGGASAGPPSLRGPQEHGDKAVDSR